MLAVGLTGGIGAGKSAVADLLVARGAALIDADVVAREVVEPGGPAYQPLIDRFGPSILADDNAIDRPRLAALTFPDEAALADLNAITHPAIGLEMLARRDALAQRDAEGGDVGVVVLAIPLLRAVHRDMLSLDAVVVVDCPTEVAIERLVDLRGMDRADAEARVAAQPSRDERREGADFVVDNSSSTEHLEGEVARLWAWLTERQRERRAAP